MSRLAKLAEAVSEDRIRAEPSWFRWSVARAIADSRLPQVSAFIPAIGYALLWSDELHKYFEIRGQLGDGLISLALRLNLLWWGAILMTAGWLIFLWRCPPEIRRHREPIDFVVEQFQLKNGVRLFQIAKWTEQKFKSTGLEGEADQLAFGTSASFVLGSAKAINPGSAPFVMQIENTEAL